MSTHAGFATLAFILIGCGDGSMTVDSGPPGRRVEATVDVAADGFSEPLELTVPDGTRSITIIASGAPDAVYALGSFQTPDGQERVGIDVQTAPGTTMRASYDIEQIGQMPGALYQSIRLGTFTHVYPYRPGQTVTAGRASLRIASDKPGPVTVTVLMPEEDGAKILHVNLIAVSETLTFAQPPSFLDEVQVLFAQAGITVVVDNATELRATGLSSITESTEPQESPASM